MCVTLYLKELDLHMRLASPETGEWESSWTNWLCYLIIGTASVSTCLADSYVISEVVCHPRALCLKGTDRIYIFV